MTYRIVETDNHGGDYPNEQFVNLPSHYDRELVKKLADLINDIHCRGDDANRFWKVVEDGYKLQPGFEP